MKTLRHIQILISVAALMLGCVKEDDILFADRTSIPLSMNDMPVIETRSIASENERKINDAYLLIFGTDGYYKRGEQVDVDASIIGNGAERPTLTTDLPIAAGEKVVVLCNSNCQFSTIPLTVDVSTINDINTEFTSSKWVFDWSHSETGFGTRRIPMCGTMVYGTESECNLIRAYSKIQLALASPEDMKGAYASTMTDAKTYWKIYNGTMKAVATIYNPTSYDSNPTPLVVTSALSSSTSFYTESYVNIPTIGHSGETNKNMTYVYEYPNATRASKTGAANLNPGEWSKDRTCIIVENDIGRFYRIDFYDHDNGVFIDFLRNHHYIVRITRVSSEGYADANEALANPSSNIEYEIIVTGEYDNYTTSNGQYALSFDKTSINVFSDESEIFKFSLKTNSDAPINLSTSIIDIVDASKTSVVSIPDNIYLNGISPTDDGSGKKSFNLGTVTAAADFTMTCSSVFRDDQAAIAALNGNFVRIRMGNITQYVPIAVQNVSLYYGTDNSFEQQPTAGTYSLDCTPYTTTSSTYAYQNTPDLELVYPRSAAMIWSDVSSDHITDAIVTQNGDKFTLTYTTTGVSGNAVIGIYDTADPTDLNARLLWSYHIWISDRSETSDQGWKTVDFSTIPGTISASYTYMMMDRNLGATSTNPPSSILDDTSSFGLLYQWGRKDPFIGGLNSNGSTLKPLYAPPGKSTPTVEAESSDAAIGTINYSIGNPLKIIKVANQGDWIFNNTYTTDSHKRWGVKTSTYVYPVTERSAKSIYDPCPSGYQVAPSDAYSMFIRASSNFSVYSANGVGGTIECANINQSMDAGFGILIYRENEMSGSTAFLPNVGAYGYQNGTYGKRAQLYWTNSHLSEKDSAYGARLGWGKGYYYSLWYLSRAAALPLRCVREK